MTKIFVPTEYNTIQKAINASNVGDTIVIKSGTYTENVIIDRAIELTSEENKDETFINASDAREHTIKIISNDVKINNLTIYGSENPPFNDKASICIDSSENCLIENNNLGQYYDISSNIGLLAINSSNNIINDNNISYNSHLGVSLQKSKNNIIQNNYMTKNLNYSIGVNESDNNIFDNNSISFSLTNMILIRSCNNQITNNDLENATYSNLYINNKSNENIITNNILIESGENGLIIDLCSKKNKILQNTINNNKIGIKINNSSLQYSSGIHKYGPCAYNEIAKNNITYNEAYGLDIVNSHSNVIYKNIFENNGFVSVRIENTNNCYFYLNEFNDYYKLQYTGNEFGNFLAYPSSVTYMFAGNKYNNVIGNYYGQSGQDSNNDGIIDEPYTLFKDAVDNNSLASPLNSYDFSEINELPDKSILKVPSEYSTINDAILNAISGDLILVDSGTYKENIIINQPITLKSNNGNENTTIEAENEEENVITIISNNVIVDGFSIYGSKRLNGIQLNEVDNCEIKNNKIGPISEKLNYTGLFILKSNHNVISNNIIIKNLNRGIILEESIDNNIIENTLNENERASIYLSTSENNLIIKNTIGENNWRGITFSDSPNNIIRENQIVNNKKEGIYFVESTKNTIDNNIISNNEHELCLLYNSNENAITKNFIKIRSSGGIQFLNSNENLLFLNIFKRNEHAGGDIVKSDNSINNWNSKQKVTYSYGNKKFKEYIGNYFDWSTTQDSNNNGLSDVPYGLPGNEGEANFVLVSGNLDDYVIFEQQPSSTKININTSTLKELKTLSGIGNTLAQKIVDYRQDRSQFTKLEQLMFVKGIGKSKFNKIKGELEDISKNQSTSNLININVALRETLTTLNRIGTVIANRIIDYRIQNHGFEIISDCIKVKGIGKATFNNIKDKITI